MTKNSLIYPSPTLFHGFPASKHDTRQGIVSLFVHASALIGGNFVLSQNMYRHPRPGEAMVSASVRRGDGQHIIL